MENLVTSRTGIEQELTEIQSYLTITMNEDATEAVNRGNDLMVHMARSGKLLADAKYHRDTKLNHEFVQQMKTISGFAPSVANKYIDTVVYADNYLVNWAERVNRSATHQLDWCRTVISKAKAEMERNY